MTKESAGWVVVNAETALSSGSIYWIPEPGDRAGLRPREHAKLIFRGECGAHTSRAGETCEEWMWVEVEQMLDGRFTGRLDNEPDLLRVQREAPVEFTPADIIDIRHHDGRKASDADGLVHCSTHGVTEVCYVCEHLGGRSANQGFNTAANAEGERPDAWCDQCDKLLDTVDGWEELGDRHPEILIVCAGCYDASRRRNEHQGTPS